MRLAVSMASKYVKYGVDTNELIQEAGIGLMKAAEKSLILREEYAFQHMLLGGLRLQYKILFLEIGHW